MKLNAKDSQVFTPCFYGMELEAYRDVKCFIVLMPVPMAMIVTMVVSFVVSLMVPTVFIVDVAIVSLRMGMIMLAVFIVHVTIIIFFIVHLHQCRVDLDHFL